MEAMDVRETLREELDRMTDAELAEVREFISKKRGESAPSEGRSAVLARIAKRRQNGPTFRAEQIEAWIRASKP